jgi:DNA-binding transcriptional MerR regulator
MKINELAGLSGVSSETIRKYRERDLLRPFCNPENGYYEYSNADFLNLLYIRKLRGSNLSLDTIGATYSGDEPAALLRGYRDTLDALEKQIALLKRREMMLRLSYRHYERDATHPWEIREIDSFGTKYDCYFEPNRIDPDMSRWIENIDLFTLVVCIGQEYFEMETLPDKIPIRIGMGTYQRVLEEAHIELPETARAFPQGKYVSFFLEVENLYTISSGQLEEVRRYLRERQLRPVSDTTAYLYCTTFSETGYRFRFCVRIRVENSD